MYFCFYHIPIFSVQEMINGFDGAFGPHRSETIKPKFLHIFTNILRLTTYQRLEFKSIAVFELKDISNHLDHDFLAHN